MKMNDIWSINKSYASVLSAPLQVQFDITNKCNFRCLHCYNESGTNNSCSDELTDEQIQFLFEELKIMKPLNICFCGGEPLLRGELIAQLSNGIKDYVPNLSIVTNGYLLNENIFYKITDAGIKRIQISLDGIKSKTHERLRCKENAFSYALNAIKLCLANRNRVKELMVSFVPTSFNISEFPDLAEYLLSIGVDSVRVQPLMISGRAKQHVLELKPRLYQYDQLFKYILKLQIKYGKNKVSWGDPVDHIIRFRKYLSSMNTNITIKSNGNIIATPYIPITFGNIKKHKLSEYWEKGLTAIWNNQKIQEYAKNINTVDDIGKCVKGYPILWEEDDLDVDIINSGENNYG